MSKDQRGNAILSVLVGLVVVAAVAGAGYVVWKKHHKSTTTSSTSSSTTTTTSGSQAQTTTLAPGTANSDLSNDLGNIGGSLNQEGSDQSNATTNLNDSQSQVSVPTN